MGITTKIYFQQPPKVVAVKNEAIFIGHRRKLFYFRQELPKNRLYFWLNIFDGQIPPKIGRYRRK
jgi:hypothetical protein